MRYLKALPLVILAFAGCSGEPLTGEESGVLSTRGDGLVGGHAAAESEYPATVFIGNCTATKVGPRHFLTAAHCISDPNMENLWVTADNNAQNLVPLTVSSVNIHPQYTNCTACTGENTIDNWGLKPDVALVVVFELTPSIPQAVIDPNPVAIGSAVTLTGYGCENGVENGVILPTGPSRLKVGDTHTIDPLLLNQAPTIPAGFITTFGPRMDPSSPGLCPGDSGGPVYRTGTDRVVGVNSLVSLEGNWHARVDQQSRYNVYAWLADLLSRPVPLPCTGICTSPTLFFSQWNSASPIGTGARCFETMANLTGGNCGGFLSPRTLTVNGTTMTCNGENWTLPPKRNHGYCISVSPGLYSYAWLTTW